MCNCILSEKSRINITFIVKLKKLATKTFQILTEDYREKTLSRVHVFERYKRSSGVWVNRKCDAAVEVKSCLKKTSFTSVEVVLVKTKNILKELPNASLQNCYQQRQHRMQKCVNAEGTYLKLRPLKTKRAEEVEYRVLSIFLTFSAPAILQSDSGREFSNQVMSEICAMWKDVKIVHRKPRHSQTQGSVERVNQDIENMLTALMNDSDTCKWSEGLPFVQFSKNTTYNEGICQRPNEAMLAVKAKRGVV
ncbi:KRAB-A domain-containing protein 2 [Trichonephila clavipes]|nr:KRAB-A domain-containing protein 2 [Trichonephila clavipes]